MARPVGHSRTIGVSRSGGCFTMSFSRERKTAKRRICLPLGFFRWIPLMSTIIIGWSSEKPFWARTVGSMPSTLNDLLVIEGVTGGLAAFVEELKERGDEFVLGNRYLRFFWRKTGYDTRLLSVHRSTINFGMRTGFLPPFAAAVRLPANIWLNTNTMLCCLQRHRLSASCCRGDEEGVFWRWMGGMLRTGIFFLKGWQTIFHIQPSEVQLGTMHLFHSYGTSCRIPSPK